MKYNKQWIISAAWKWKTLLLHFFFIFFYSKRVCKTFLYFIWIHIIYFVFMADQISKRIFLQLFVVVVLFFLFMDIVFVVAFTFAVEFHPFWAKDKKTIFNGIIFVTADIKNKERNYFIEFSWKERQTSAAWSLNWIAVRVMNALTLSCGV